MKRLVVGILAHVDAGKTTLSESMLYLSGKIRRMGRVDNRDAYLDTYELERLRGITIFSKQAVMNFGETEVILLDTPGHVDFSAEMERTLQVMDYGILVISGSGGVQSHTRTVWELLKSYDVPTFIFVNKMDQPGTSCVKIMDLLQKELGDSCIAFDSDSLEEWFEQLAMCDEKVMENYIENGKIDDKDISDMICNRKIFPVYFGSALRQIGIETFAKGIIKYTFSKAYPSDFGAKVFKITRDSQGNRLTHMKITGGILKVKDVIRMNGIEEKINQIRIYSGEKYNTESILEAGSICAVTGLSRTRPGEGIGIEEASNPPRLEPVLSYQVILPDGIEARQVLPMLLQLEEEEPELHVIWNEILQEINIQVMGTVQLEVLEAIILDRFDIKVSFDHGEVVYKETIINTCEGVGHFEPLRHYAEVHLILEPGQRGSGICFQSVCSEDILDRNWQRLILTHLQEKPHIGVLTGSHITDMKITLVTGRAHNKHTEGGDFREATFRALRQGLKEAKSILLEPYYNFKLILPENMVGRGMTDIGNMNGSCVIESSNGSTVILSGYAPVVSMRNYHQELSSYTKGEGRLYVTFGGYKDCHNTEEIIERIEYDSEKDFNNPTGSVFCSKGSGFLVPWYEVKKYMDVEGVLKSEKNKKDDFNSKVRTVSKNEFISLEEINKIVSSTYSANQGKKNGWKNYRSVKENYYESMTYHGTSRRNMNVDEYLLVDGYNIIHAWDELKDLAETNLESARLKLVDILSNYQPMRDCQIMVVFDAYRIEGRNETVEKLHNICVVFTGEAQTADHFIEKFAHANKDNYRIIVATSDALEQMIIRGAGAQLMSTRELKEAIYEAENKLNREHLSIKKESSVKLEDVLSIEEKTKLKK